MKFQDMPDGTHFTDGKRKFIKLQTILPSGLSQTHERVVGEDRLSFNSIDYSGISANCPDWYYYEDILL